MTSRTRAPHGAPSCYSPQQTPACIQHHIESQQRSGRPDFHCFHTDLRSPPHAFVLQLQLLMVAAGEDFSERRDGAGQNTSSQCNETRPLKGTCEQNNLNTCWSETIQSPDPDLIDHLHTILHRGLIETSTHCGFKVKITIE